MMKGSIMNDKKPHEELEIIRKILELLDPLNFQDQRRVITYLDNYYTAVWASQSPISGKSRGK